MKKIICLLLALTLVFTLCACGKEKDTDRKSNRKNFDKNIVVSAAVEKTTESAEPSVETTEPETFYIYSVTDRNDDGALVVYVTDANGKFVTEINGDLQTEVHPFAPISREGSVEYFGYKIALPKGWTITNVSNRFVNENIKCYATVHPISETYEDYYISQREIYDMLAEETPDEVSWTEDVYIGEGCTGVVRFTLNTSDGARIMYFFENSGNLYKILFESEDFGTILNDSLVFCKSITYLPYQYFVNN